MAVTSGGRALTAYLAPLGWTPRRSPWEALRMPDVAVLELAPGEAARMVIPFGTSAYDRATMRCGGEGSAPGGAGPGPADRGGRKEMDAPADSPDWYGR